ncbi:nucleolar and coiled-body phosphoprotein 1 [Drosophila tropicalis]|uniref:nucleolar and coiled-body phosphoprotein 1 n=1 Tax=Drosophila tropicalis TaxID=46794 RepID=UPI0035AB8097
MRAGRKTEAETGKTRSCIVYVKNLGTGPAEVSGGETKILRSCKKLANATRGGGAAASASSLSTRGAKTLQSVPTKLSNVSHVNLQIATPVERRQSTRREVAIRERGQPVRGGATTPAETTASSVAQRSRSAGKGASPIRAKPLTTPAAKTSKRDREKEREKPVSIRRRNTIVTTPQPAAKLSQRRNTQNDEGATTGGGGAVKSKMFKQASKIMASSSSQSSLSSPPTIAASRSRRSIKPNPKYASDDVVTPKYMVSLAHESSNSRSGGGAKQLFATQDDDDMIEIDEDRNDVDEDDDDEEEEEEEDNDDEVTDAAFNPHLHKSDDDDDDEDDLSDPEFEREVRPPPIKRGRGRPPKAGNTSAAGATKTTTAISASASSQSTVRTAGSSTQRNNLHQLRRSIATNMNKSKLAAAASQTPATTPGNKRKLEDPGESAVIRKRVALNGAANTKAPAAASQPTPKTNKPTSVGAGAVRIVQAPQSVGGKQRLSQGQSFKINQAARAGSGAAAATPRSSSSQQMRVPPAPPAGPAESDDVPTFTIVNIDDIINQDDVLISRSSQSAATPTATTTAATLGSNKAAKQISPLSRGAKMQTRRGAAGGQSSTSITTPQTPVTPNSNSTTKRMITLGQVGGAKSRPRILNAEMSKKAPAMKPLMSMGKELCNIDTEEEEEDRDHEDDHDAGNVVQEQQLAKAAAVKKISIRGATGGGAANRLTSSSQKPQQKWLSSTQQPTPTRNVLSTTANNRAAGGAGGISSGPGDRKLAKFLGEGNDELLFKKPQQQQRLKENATDNTPSKKEESTNMTKYLPAETTTFCEEDGRMIKKITCYETWHVIGLPVGIGGGDNSAIGGGGANSDILSRKPRVQRTSLEFPLVKLANVAGRIKVPSNKWSSKVTLYKVSPTLMARQTMTIFTGDLKSFNIPEEERHKYQPSCVLFRRSVLDRSKCRVPYDRAIIFKNKCFYANIDGKHINLMGAPEAVSSVKDVEILLDIVDRLSLSSSLVETVNGK